MSNPFPISDSEVIDVPPPKRRRWRRYLLAGILLLFLAFSRILAIYVSALWFGSIGYSPVYWYIFKLKAGLFVVFLVLTVLILRGAFWLLERAFAAHALEKRTIMVNNQPFEISPARFIRPLAWLLAIGFGIFTGLAMRGAWQEFANYFNQAPTNLYDPIFQKSLGFYLFSLPLLEAMSSWLMTLAFVVLCAALAYSLLTIPGRLLKQASTHASTTAFSAVSCALAAFLVMLAGRTYLSRFPYLWTDHQTFSGVTYTEANYLLPALLFVAFALLIAAAISLLNAFTKRGFRLLILALALPIAVYIIGVILVPAYVNGFIVKPNELARETPYIEHNIAWTRRGFGLEQIQLRQFDAENSVEALNLGANRATLDNIRLWDWRALKDTLKQVQTIRTYYDFPDVDVDRYSLGGQTRQVMLAAREMDVEKLPEASRNWINEKLVYTHGYGLTMNTSNGFTPEGMPRFILSDMPIKSGAPEATITRPQIYYGQKTDTDVYVKTAQKEFDFPQGETNTYTTYEGTGGIQIGNRFRRWLLAWALNDLSKLPFSDDVTPESRVLIHRNIKEIVNGVAPFLIYDNDPYIVVSKEGRLFWMLDAFTESATFPYSRHHQVGNNRINYIRNSVKVVIDAYNGSVDFYVFDPQDPLIATYRATFPTLFKDASAMPADLRAHVRYPETLIRVQGEVYGLYHTQSPKVFFQREDVWSVASQLGIDDQNKKQSHPIDPYFVLMQLPGEQTSTEFALILPFTPANRNNMIGWMAGRSDGEHYGKLLVYNFPESRVIEGPLQIEARIDQNAQLSAQFSLWNQQGSRVLRGHLLVIPIGRSLLYVEPVYLQAERSPMPELRLVVLAIQERLGYGQSFDEAMTNLFGDAGKTVAQVPTAQSPSPGQEVGKPVDLAGKPTPSPAPVAVETVQRLIIKAVQEFDDYQRLTSQGKHGEAGQKLEQHKRTLEELKRLGSKQ
ncbi:MAG: UPF0182 family protein [Pyrinomonadaceae bacterium]|nr:UPF0182 family protein [Pyrinomonadaceae bacterium]